MGEKAVTTSESYMIGRRRSGVQPRANMDDGVEDDDDDDDDDDNEG